MKQIMEALWRGTVGFDPESRELSPGEREAMKRLAVLRDELQAGMCESQMEKINLLDEGYAELMALGEEETFCYAFCLGARLMMEIMQFGE